jgi:restriction endonuclease S subunit
MRDNWTETTLGQIAVFYNGKAYKQQELLEEGKYRVLRVGNFFSNGNWYWSDLELDKNKYCDTGDLLYAWSASFGPRIWSEEKVIYHYHIWKIEENLLKVEKKFLYFWLEDDVQRMKRDAGTGSIMMHITKGDIEVRQINLPPIAEQKRIVDVVSSVDAYINALQQQVDTARTARNAVLHELLSAVSNNWTETTLDELVLSGVILLGRGNVISKKDMEADPGPFPVYSSAQNNDGRIGTYNQFMFDEELITWSVDGGGHVFYRKHHKFSVTNIGGYLRILNSSKFLYPFLAAVLQKLHGEHIFDWQNKAHPSVIRKLYNNIPLAPIAEQQRIVDVVSSMDDVIQAAEGAVVEAKNLRSGLLSDLLSGEHEIPVSYDELLGAA